MGINGYAFFFGYKTGLMAMNGYRPMHDIKNITITPERLKLVA
jgi:hypothetical protein